MSEKESTIIRCKTALIDPKAKLALSVKVWSFTKIREDAEIDSNTVIGQCCYIDVGVKIGKGCKIQNGVSIYQGVELEDNVFVGPNATFMNDISPRAEYPKHDIKLYKKTLIKEGATIGGNATILPGIIIGKYSMIGAGSVVTKDVLDYAIVYDNPAYKQSGYGYICECGEGLRDKLIPNDLEIEKLFHSIDVKCGELFVCECGKIYTLRGVEIKRLGEKLEDKYYLMKYKDV